MRFFLACGLLLSFSHIATATTYYVSGTGSDTANGHSKKHAFRTLQHAADLTLPGDIVLAMDGVYSADSAQHGDVLSINRSGTAAKWITYKALPGQHPTVQTKNWNGIGFEPGASYVEVNGFTVTGNIDNVDHKEALRRGSLKNPVPDPAYDGNCIAIDGRKGAVKDRPHHLRILNNTISKCGGGGVATMFTDYVTISGNTVSDCSWYSIYGTSGISTLEDWNSDDYTGYKMIITGNRLHGNKELVPWIEVGKISDGEAIIIDTLRSPNIGTYKGRTLVAENVIFDNGSAAIEVFQSDHVDILNNSTYHNVQVPEETGRGELGVSEALDVTVRNNIFYSATGQNPVVNSVQKPCDCKFESNLYYNGSNLPDGLKGADDMVADPLYLNLDLTHPTTVDLRVAKGSPAVNSGIAPPEASTAFLATRAAGSGFDRGAHDRR